MTQRIRISVNGMPQSVTDDVTLAAALFNVGVAAFRRDLHGNARAPLCGMGSCFECRVTVDGVRNVRACLEPVRAGMIVETAP